jgi:hypothetical protein
MHAWYATGFWENTVEYRCVCGAFMGRLNPLWVAEVRREIAESLGG